MKKGQSYICFHIRDKPKHPLSKALFAKGYVDDGYIIYASHWATDSGWCVDGCFLGYTITEALKEISTYSFVIR